MGEREKHEASRAQRANENIQVRVENGLWSQKETSLATDNSMEEIRRNTGQDDIKTVLEDKKMWTNTSTKWARMGCNQ